jgi:hypothetical protein
MFVRKLYELMAFGDRLKENIKESQAHHNEMLLEQVLREALLRR